MGVALTVGLLAAPAIADPVDGGWRGAETRSNDQCFIMTGDHVSDDPSGMFTTSVNMHDSDAQDVRMLFQWTQRQMLADPAVPKRGDQTLQLHIVSYDASGQGHNRGSYAFTTRLAGPDQRHGVLAFGAVPTKLIVDIRNDVGFDVYRGSSLLRSVKLDGFHAALENLSACTATPAQ